MHDNTQTKNTGALDGYVDAPKLLEILFAAECRPSLRWLRDNQNSIPHVRIGRLVFFDPPAVKAHFDAKNQRRTEAARRG